MTEQKPAPSLAEAIAHRARQSDARLRKSPFYARLLRGAVSRDEYGAWLVQLYKYIHVTAPESERVLADAMAARILRGDWLAKLLRDYATETASEEAGHDELVIADLAVLHEESHEEARARIAREPDAPSVYCYRKLIDTMHARFPEGIIGVGLALQTLATLESDEIRQGLVASSAIPGVERAVTFLAAHSGEVESWHVEEDAKSTEWLVGAKERSAAYFFADLSLALFEGIAHFLSERFRDARREATSTGERALEPAHG